MKDCRLKWTLWIREGRAWKDRADDAQRYYCGRGVPMTHRNILPALGLLAFNLWPGFAVDLRQRETLKGLRGVQVTVIVRGLDDSRNADLQRSLQVGTELRLRQNKITVLETSPSVPGRPVFTLVLVFYESNDRNVDGLAFFVESNVAEDASLSRNSKDVKAVTYQSLVLVGLTNSGVLREQVRRSCSEVVDSFINDFLAENPLP
jgi:hypothetical protein